MSLVSVLRNALFILAPLSLVLSTYLYCYPVFVGCAFPAPEQDARTAYISTLNQHLPFAPLGPKKPIAPFRLLSLGDPQLEGDTSIPDPEAANFPSLSKFWKDALLLDGTKHNTLQRLRHSLHDLVDFYLDDIPKSFEIYRKRLDHIGNDYYLGHIYRTLYWWAKPTHVTVLGDLVGSQWIDDAEFESRGWRFWNRVFNGGARVPDEITLPPAAGFNETLILGDNAAAWKKRIINVAGNHDIGYAGDLSHSRMDRFTKTFGKPNYEMRFQLSTQGMAHDGKSIPELRIVVLNDMNLDTPAGSAELQAETYDFLNSIITHSKDVERDAHFTIVLTHIPLYKEAGVCVDGPLFDFFSGDFSNGVKEQNHLSKDASKGLLEGVFGMSGNPNVAGQGFGRNGVILTGHDHEGCDIYHYINHTAPPEREWQATTWNSAVSQNITAEPGVPGMREITVRSMMGDFSGNAGLFSLWFDEDVWDWKFEFSNCELGKQHFWWAVHVLNVITLGVGTIYGICAFVQRLLQISTVQPRPKNAPGHVKAHGSLRSSRKVYSGSVSTDTTQLLQTNGKLGAPGAGKRSLRKKKSKINMNGGSSNGSVTSIAS